MLVRKVSRETLDAALAEATMKYRGNLRWAYEPVREGSGYRFRITTDSYDRPGWRTSAPMMGRNGRKLRSACWHAHRDLFRAILRREPNAIIVTAFARYTAETFENTFPDTYFRNAGSMMEPSYFGSLCSHPGDGPDDGHSVEFGTIHPNGQMTNARTIRTSDLLACPFTILMPEHYRDDGTCRCNDPDHRAKMIRDWEYTEDDFRRVGIV